MIPAIKWLNCCEDKLFTIDSDTFTLYNVLEVPKQYGHEFLYNQINSCSASIPTVKQEQDAVRSFALDHSPDNYLAIGFTSGRISVFPADNVTTKFMRGEEIREVQKSIAYLEWNFINPNRLCAAYERSRGPDHTVIVYDLNRTSSKNARELAVSVFETNFTERIHGISWFKEDPNLLLISGSRGIRIADIREHGNFQSTLSTPNPLMGVSSEPNGFIFSCYSRNSIFVYDRRFLTYSPLHEIEACSSNKGISKLSWHPRRSFHMSAITKDSGNFYNFFVSSNAFRSHYQKTENSFHHLQTDSHRETAEYIYGTCLYSVPGISKIGSFDWHPLIDDCIAFLPTHPVNYRLMTSNPTKELFILNLKENVYCSINCDSELAITSEKLLNIDKHALKQIDKIQIIKDRISNGYGYGNTASPISTLIENSRTAIGQDPCANDDLKFCWQWLWMAYQSADAIDMQKTFGTIFYGVKHVLKGTKSNSTIKNDEITYRNRIFANERRLKIVRMCNWPNYNDRDECKIRFDELCGNDVHGIARAAAVALFSVQGTLSKEYLVRLNDFVHSQEFLDDFAQSSEFVSSYQRMADVVLNVIQKYDGVRVPDYENVCNEICSNAYLLAIVKFLARRDKIYNRIYNEIFESDIEFEDKLAFAALHMDDDFLGAALNKLTKEMLISRPLSTLFIVGLEDQAESHQVIHRFLDITEDIQTASILFIIGNCFIKFPELHDLNLVGASASEIWESAIQSGNYLRRRSLQCVRDYMEVLNRCKLWLQKSFLCTLLRPNVQPNDLDLRSQLKNIQAVIACNYCGQPIYPSIAEKIENIRTPKINPSNPRRAATNVRTRTMSCICRKVLPRCIICRKHLGSQLAVADTEMNDGVQENTGVIDNWFVWCGSCNHGGHLAHIRQWFNQYAVCASSGCDCFCLQMDHQLGEEILPLRRQEM